MDCHQILNTGKNATRKQLQEARDTLLAKLKDGVIEEELRNAAELERIINDAYEVLTSSEGILTDSQIPIDIAVREDLKNMLWNLHNQYYHVKLLNYRHDATSVNMPKCCVCCASENVVGHFKIKRMRSLYYVAADTMVLKFPLCAECKRHVRWTRLVYYLVTVLPAVIATVIATLLRASAGHDEQVLINLILLPAIALTVFLLSAWAVRFKPASLGHSAHRFPAKFIVFNNKDTICGFYNRFFAEKFTRANGASLFSEPKRKPRFASCFLIGYEKPWIAISATLGWAFLAMYLSLGIVPYK